MVKWEPIADDTFRLAVPGGWLVATANKMNNTYAVASTVFVADPQHTWTVMTSSDPDQEILKKLQSLKIRDEDERPDGPWVSMHDLMATFGFTRQDSVN